MSVLLLLLAVSFIVTVVAFGGLRLLIGMALLATALGVLGWFTRDAPVSSIAIFILRVQSHDAAVLRWACPWTPNGGTCITDLKGVGPGVVALPAAMVVGAAIRRGRLGGWSLRRLALFFGGLVAGYVLSGFVLISFGLRPGVLAVLLGVVLGVVLASLFGRLRSERLPSDPGVRQPLVK